MIVICSPSAPTQSSGGVRKLFDLNDILNDAGLPARMSIYGNPLRVDADDLLVVPEVYGDELRTMAPGVPRVSFNQNFHYSWQRVADPTKHPYIDNPDLRAVLAVSRHTQDALRWTFPGLNVKRWFTSVGRPEDFYCGPFPRDKRICYFGRKKGDRAALVLNILGSKGVLDGWDVVNMDGMTDAVVGAMMRSSAFFLSFSELEGFGSPPIEAMACGCVVIGFAGFGGREYFLPQYARTVPEDDVWMFASVVMSEIMHHEDESRSGLYGRAASIFALSSYPRETERATLVEIFKELV